MCGIVPPSTDIRTDILRPRGATLKGGMTGLGRQGGPTVRVVAARRGGRLLGSGYIALAASLWSLAGILQRQLHMSVPSQLAGRAVFAVTAVFVLVAVAERGHVVRAFRAIGR